MTNSNSFTLVDRFVCLIKHYECNTSRFLQQTNCDNHMWRRNNKFSLCGLGNSHTSLMGYESADHLRGVGWFYCILILVEP